MLLASSRCSENLNREAYDPNDCASCMTHKEWRFVGTQVAANNHLPQLDGLRGVAILIVALGHLRAFDCGLGIARFDHGSDTSSETPSLSRW